MSVRSGLWRLRLPPLVRGAGVSSLWRSRVWRFGSCSLRERRRRRGSRRRGRAARFVLAFGRFWFSLCAFLGRGLGSALARLFFVVAFPPSWSWRSRSWRAGGGFWVRRAPVCCWGLWRFGFSGRWVCVPPSALPALRASAFVWSVFPAVVGRVSGVVLRLWVFVSPSGETNTEEKRARAHALSASLSIAKWQRESARALRAALAPSFSIVAKKLMLNRRDTHE